MGLFNAMYSISKVNQLLKDLENQVTISQDMVRRGASRVELERSLNVLKKIHQDLIDTFADSSAARVAMFSIFGDKMQMHDILTYSKNVIYNLAGIIANR